MDIDKSVTQNLLAQIRELIFARRKIIAQSVDIVHVLTCFEIGQRIVAQEQHGQERAEYGKETLKEVARLLTKEFGNGFSVSNLEHMRKFYLQYRSRLQAKSQTVSGVLVDTLSMQIAASGNKEKAAKRASPFPLSWSHYVFLLAIKDDAEREFYEIEATQQQWSLRELKRQFNASLYERLALSRNKTEIVKLAQQGQIVAQPKDLLRDPYVLEFLGLEERSKYSESDLEAAIIEKLEHFLLELGKGFLFEARQKRFTFGEEHFFVDLVFYNRLLRCYVLLDLKIGKLTHQDLGQMQMYVNYFDRFVKLAEENSTVGIILCKQKHDALVEITLPKEANIFAAQYQIYLPSKEELRQKLLDWVTEQETLAGESQSPALEG